MLLIDRDRFRKDVDRLDNMPSLPGLMNKLTRMVNDPAFSIHNISEEIGKDQVLAAKVLKLVNSAFYGFPGRISTLSHALLLLGYDVIKAIILSTTVFDYMRERMLDLWLHSLAVSRTADFIASKIGEADSEEVTLAGLLHDIGKVVFKLKVPDKYDLVVEAAGRYGISTLTAERKLFGFDHADVAFWICERWSLPEKLAIPLGFHHAVSDAGKNRRQTAILALADLLTAAAGMGADGDRPLFPHDPAILDILGLEEEAVVAMFREIEPELPAIKAELGMEN